MPDKTRLTILNVSRLPLEMDVITYICINQARIQGKVARVGAHPWDGETPFKINHSIAFKHQSITGPLPWEKSCIHPCKQSFRDCRFCETSATYVLFQEIIEWMANAIHTLIWSHINEALREVSKIWIMCIELIDVHYIVKTFLMLLPTLHCT